MRSLSLKEAIIALSRNEITRDEAQSIEKVLDCYARILLSEATESSCPCTLAKIAIELLEAKSEFAMVRMQKSDEDV